ncbi:MAG: type VI secretion system Vgr family protein [Janthinobacterium lividum]
MPASPDNRQALVTAPRGATDHAVTLECTGLDAGPFWVTELEGSERLSAPWRFELVVAIPYASTSTWIVDQLVGRSARLRLPAAQRTRVFKGLIRRAMELNPALGMRRFRVLLAAEISLLGDVVSAEIYIDSSIDELIEHIMQQTNPVTAAYREALGYRIKIAPAVASASRRAFLFQNNETALAFLQHRLACEGAYYYFEQAQESATAVFCDKLAQQPTDACTVHFRANRDRSARETMSTLSYFGSERRAATLLNSHAALLTRYAMPSDEKPGCMERELDRLAQLCNAARACRSQLYLGRGDCFGVQAGYPATIVDHWLPDLNGTYQVIAVKHRYRYESAEYGGNRHRASVDALSGHTPYRCTFCALPQTTQFYSDPLADRRTPLLGVSSAHIDGEGDDTFPELDGQGRYRVKFAVGTSKENGRASGWVRRVQARVGALEGVHFPLRKGTEVMVAFEHGNPHLPVIVGAVADAENVDVVNDRNSQQTVLKSGAGDLIFDDSSKNQIELSTAAARPKAAANQPGGSTLPRTECERIRLASQRIEFRVGDNPSSPDTRASFGPAGDSGKAEIALQSTNVKVSADDNLALGNEHTQSSTWAAHQVNVAANKQLHMAAPTVVIESEGGAGLSIRITGSSINLG